jgi:hypothetical protein
MNLESNQLSMEQEFMHQVFTNKIRDLSYEETKDLLLKFHKQMLFKDNLCRDISSKSQKIANQLLDC